MNVLLNGYISAFRKNNEPLLPEETIKCTLTDDVIKNKQKWCYCQSKVFSGTSDTIRYLKTFKMISNEMPILLLILC